WSAEAHDDALDLVLAPCREERRALHRADARADADFLQVVADRLGQREEGRKRREIARVESGGISGLGEQLLRAGRVVRRRVVGLRAPEKPRPEPPGGRA